MIKKLIALCVILIVCTISPQITAMPDVMAEGAILIEAKTNTILYEKNAKKRFYPASMTKILTALIVEEQLPDSALIYKTQDSVRTVPADSSHIGLQIGDSYDKTNALYGLLLGSDNFIAHDLALKVSGNLSDFAKLMNQKAKEAGAFQTHFTNPHGYHDVNHYTTPYDMAQIARLAFSNATIEKIAGTKNYNFYVQNKKSYLSITNSSRLLKSETPYYNAHVIACKTGFHDDAKQTLVAKARYGEMELIAVVMKDNTPNQYIDVNKLFEYGKTYFSVEKVGGKYWIKNNTASNWSKAYIQLAQKQGWLNEEGKNYTEAIKVEELVGLLKTIGAGSKQTVTMSEVETLVGLKQGDTLTRAEAARLMKYTMQKWKVPKRVTEVMLAIPDLTSAPSDSREAIQYVASREVLGTSNLEFRPNENLTREEAICMLYKFRN